MDVLSRGEAGPPSAHICEGRKVERIGLRAGPEQGIAVSDAAALSTQDGKCYFGLQFELVNAGTAQSGPFEFALAAQGEQPTKRKSGPLAPGAAGGHNAYAYLRPGTNLLSLTVDSAQQVAEGDEGNNALSVTVTVNGSCGGVSPSARPAPERQAPIRVPR